MKARTSLALTGLLAAGATTLAFAQATFTAPDPTAPVTPGPVASAFKADGPDGQLATSVAQDLVAEPMLIGSKIAVTAEGGALVTLTGVTETRAQMQRAVEIATAQAGEGKVVNAIQTEEMYVAPDRPADKAAVSVS